MSIYAFMREHNVLLTLYEREGQEREPRQREITLDIPLVVLDSNEFVLYVTHMIIDWKRLNF